MSVKAFPMSWLCTLHLWGRSDYRVWGIWWHKSNQILEIHFPYIHFVFGEFCCQEHPLPPSSSQVPRLDPEDSGPGLQVSGLAGIWDQTPRAWAPGKEVEQQRTNLPNRCCVLFPWAACWWDWLSHESLTQHSLRLVSEEVTELFKLSIKSMERLVNSLTSCPTLLAWMLENGCLSSTRV